MGTKLNWGAALNSLADSLRTYAAMQQREQEIKQEREFQLKRDKSAREAWLEAQKGLSEFQRGEQLGNVPMATGQMGSYGSAGGFPIPRVEGQDVPVYRQDLEGTGSLLGRRLAQLQGWGEKETPEAKVPIDIAGRTFNLPEGDAATLEMRRLLDNPPGGGRTVNPPRENAQVLDAITSTMGDADYYNARLLGVDDDIRNQVWTEYEAGVPLRQAIANAVTAHYGEVPQERIGGLSAMLSDLLPAPRTYEEGKGKDKKQKIMQRAASIKNPGKKRRFIFDALKKDDAPGYDIAPFKEALQSFEEFKQEWQGVIRNGKITPRELAEIRERFGLDEEEFFSLVAIYNQAQGADPKLLIESLTPGPEGK